MLFAVWSELCAGLVQAAVVSVKIVSLVSNITSGCFNSNDVFSKNKKHVSTGGVCINVHINTV